MSSTLTEHAATDGNARSGVGSSRALIEYVVMVAGILVLSLLSFVLPYSVMTTGIVWAIYASAAVGLNLLTGVAGMPSVGTAAFMAVGAYAVVLIPFADRSLWGGLIAAGVVGAIAGGLAGLPALRLSGFYLAVGTLAMQFVVQNGGQELERSTDHYAGYVVRPATVLPGVEITSQRSWFITAVIMLGICMLVAHRWMRCHIGRGWLAIRESRSVALASGIAVGRQKCYLFVLSSVMIGTSGALLGFYDGNVDYQTFSLTLGIQFVAMIIIGGLGNLWGAPIGAAVVVYVPYLLEQIDPSAAGGTGWLATNQYVLEDGIYGLLIVVFLVASPTGVVGLFAAGDRAVRRSLARRRSSAGVDGGQPT